MTITSTLDTRKKKEIRHLKIREISLVDDPANPHALIEIVKSKQIGHAPSAVPSGTLNQHESYELVAKTLGSKGVEGMLMDIAKGRARSTGRSAEQEYATVIAERPELYTIWRYAKRLETTTIQKG